MARKQQHLNCLPHSEAQELMAIPKSSHATLAWKSANNQNYLACEFVPQDERDELGGTLAGAIVSISYKPIRTIKDNDKLLITQHQITQGIKNRVYQIEANHKHIISCRDKDTLIYGSHEHIGERVYPLLHDYAVNDLPNWFTLFCEKTNLSFSGSLPQMPEREQDENFELQHTG